MANMKKTLTHLCSKVVGTNVMGVLLSSSMIIDICELRLQPQFCKVNLFLCFVNITFMWLKPASAMYEARNASKNGSAAALI